jgi:hypothetical protein
MDDELLTRAPTLVSVVLTRVNERISDAVAVDRDRRPVGVLFDDRKQVVEQPLLELVEFSGRGNSLSDGRSRRGRPRWTQFAALGFDPLRNR